MDSMDLEREKGITIQSAATYCTWKDYQVFLKPNSISVEAYKCGFRPLHFRFSALVDSFTQLDGSQMIIGLSSKAMSYELIS